jgi:hypothetical protein
MKACISFLLILFLNFNFLWAEESPQGFVKAGSEFIFANLKQDDSRKEVMEKLRSGGFKQIYEERENELIKCTLRLNGFRYELTSKLKDDQLRLCLIEGQKGWQFSFYEDVVEPQWENLRKILVEKYGVKRKTREFPDLVDVPLNDKGGYITDTWDLSDRLLILTILSFEVKDCCTNQLVEYSCCTLLIQPKVEI